jgi:type IV pilus assembly protein PilB
MRSLHDSLTGLIAHLEHDGLLKPETAAAAYASAKQLHMPQVSYLVRFNILSCDDILAYCAKQFGLPIFSLHEFNRKMLSHPIIKPELIFRYRVMPIKIEQDTLYLGVADPTDQTAISAISFHTGLRVSCLLISEVELNDLINEMLKKTQITPLDNFDASAETTEISDEPVINFVTNLMQEAMEKHISDIHIEPFANHCRIRFRRDGLLYEATTIPLPLAERVVTRLKIMAQIDIAERRLPQDGRIQIRHHEKLDIRVNTCPTLFGEKLVLRLLNANAIRLDLSELGLTDKQHKLLLDKLNDPQGLIFVTGPTGSGKTITLYAALQHLNGIEKNISSVEDPVEIELAGINQINANTKIGLDFATVLRTLLRQDPDIIMVGEVRDVETAQIAAQAAQTGHLVLSTLHTNSAIETISRLQAMGIPAYQIATSLSLMIAQRLARKLCDQCKDIEHLMQIPGMVTYRAVGCKYCHHGYRGRVGLFELIPMTTNMAHLLLEEGNQLALLDEVKKQKHMLLWEAGMEKVKLGVTSYEELIRVMTRDAENN